MSEISTSSLAILFRGQDEAGPVDPYVTVCPGQLSKTLTFSPLSSEENKLYKLPTNNFGPSWRYSGHVSAVSPSIRFYECVPYTRKADTLECRAMKPHRNRSKFGAPLEDLPHYSDQVCCSNWNSTGEFVEKSGLPVEKFEWSREINEDTGEWWIHGQALPTLTEKLVAKWLWLKTKPRLLLRRARSNRW